MIGIVDRLKFDAARCELHFSKGVAGNISEAAAEIERLSAQWIAETRENERLQARANEVGPLKAEIVRLSIRNERLRTALGQLRRHHHICQDGCLDPGWGSECNCGASAHNAIIDAALDGEQSAVNGDRDG